VPPHLVYRVSAIHCIVVFSLLTRYAAPWTEQQSVPCLQSLVGACGFKSTGGCTPTRREIPPRLGLSVQGWDLDAFRHVKGSIKAGQPSDPERKRPVVPTWNNSDLHRFFLLAPVVATDSVATSVSVWRASTTHPLAAFRLRHDAGALSLLGACIQDSSQVRYRQGWALWK
jgi:hypothetical protein